MAHCGLLSSLDNILNDWDRNSLPEKRGLGYGNTYDDKMAATLKKDEKLIRNDYHSSQKNDKIDGIDKKSQSVLDHGSHHKKKREEDLENRKRSKPSNIGANDWAKDLPKYLRPSEDHNHEAPSALRHHKHSKGEKVHFGDFVRQMAGAKKQKRTGDYSNDAFVHDDQELLKTIRKAYMEAFTMHHPDPETADSSETADFSVKRKKSVDQSGAQSAKLHDLSGNERNERKMPFENMNKKRKRIQQPDFLDEFFDEITNGYNDDDEYDDDNEKTYDFYNSNQERINQIQNLLEKRENHEINDKSKRYASNSDILNFAIENMAKRKQNQHHKNEKKRANWRDYLLSRKNKRGFSEESSFPLVNLSTDEELMALVLISSDLLERASSIGADEY